MIPNMNRQRFLFQPRFYPGSTSSAPISSTLHTSSSSFSSHIPSLAPSHYAPSSSPVTARSSSPAPSREIRRLWIFKRVTRMILDHGRNGKLSHAIRTFDSVSNPNPHLLSALITACKIAGKPQRGIAIFKQWAKVPSMLNTHVYNSTIACCEKLGAGAKARNEGRAQETGGIKAVTPRESDVESHTEITTVTPVSRVPTEYPDLHTALRLMRDTAFQPRIISGVQVRDPKLGLQTALRLLDDMKQIHVPPDEITYNSCITCCEPTADYQQALILLRNMEQQEHLVPSVVTYTACIRVCAEARQWQLALQLLDRMKTFGVTPDIITYNACITACERAQRPREALVLLDMLKLQGLSPNIVTYSACISACGNDGTSEWVDVACKLWEELKNNKQIHPNVVSYTAIISACSKGKRWEIALRLLNEMKKTDIQPNWRTFVAAMNACIHAHKPRQALVLFRQMKQHDIKPNAIAYSAVISACEQAGLWRKALDFYELMQAKGKKPNALSYAAAISACAKGLQTDKALQILKRMKKENIIPTPHTYTECIQICHKASRSNEAIQLFQDMQKEGVVPIFNTFRAVLDAYAAESGYSSIAMQLVDDMQSKHNLKPDLTMYNALLMSCEKDAQDQTALQLLDVVRHDPSLRADVVTYTACIGACANAGNWTQALELMEELVRINIAPQVNTYNACIYACEKANQWEAAKTLFVDMKVKHGLEPDINTYLSMLRLIAESSSLLKDDAETLWKDMKKARISPGFMGYSAMIDVYTSAGDHIKAKRLRKEMRIRNIV